MEIKDQEHASVLMVAMKEYQRAVSTAEKAATAASDALTKLKSKSGVSGAGQAVIDDVIKMLGHFYMKNNS